MDNKVKYAGFILRFSAYLFDQLLILTIPLFIFFLVITNSKNSSQLWFGFLWFLWELIFLQWIIYWLYLITTYIFFKASVGKILTGLSIEKEDGSDQNLKDALIRFPVGYTISNLIFSFGFLWILKDVKKKGLHDHFAGTVVIKKNSSLPIIILLPILILLFIFLLYSTIKTGITNGVWSQIYIDFGKLLSYNNEI